MAYRVDLDSGDATAMEHCGMSRPWLTRDGRMLVCEERGPGDNVRFLLRTPGTGEERGLTEGPVDVAAFPLDRDDMDGCGVRSRR